MAFAQIEPFGGPVEDLRAGLAPSVAINMNRAPTDADGFDTEPIDALAFYQWHNEPKPEPEPESPEVLAAKLRSFLNAKARPDGN